MSARPSAAVTAAVRSVQRGSTVTAAADKHGCAVSSVRRALRALGVPPMARGRPRKPVPNVGP